MPKHLLIDPLVNVRPTLENLGVSRTTMCSTLLRQWAFCFYLPVIRVKSENNEEKGHAFYHE